MKFKTLSILFILVVGLFLVVLCKPSMVGAGQNQIKAEWIEIKGAEFKEVEKNLYIKECFKDKYGELTTVLNYLYEKDDFNRMGILLERQGAIILGPDESKLSERAMTGRDAMAQLFSESRSKGKKLEFGPYIKITAGAIDKVMDGWEVDRFALLEFTFTVSTIEEGKVTQNQQHLGYMTLFHRKVCTPDG